MSDLAEVATLTDGDAGWELSKLVGGRLSCYWGAVRLYWPGFDSRTSKAYEHPVWLSGRIAALGLDGLLDDLVESLSDGPADRVPTQGARRVSVSPPGPAAPSSTADPRIAKPERDIAEERRLREAAEARTAGLETVLAEERQQRATAERGRAEAGDEDQAQLAERERKWEEVQKLAQELLDRHERVEEARRTEQEEHRREREQLAARRAEAEDQREQAERERDAATDRADAADRNLEEAEGERDAASAQTAIAEEARRESIGEAKQQREADANRIRGLEREQNALRERLESEGGEEEANLIAVEKERDGERKRADDAEDELGRARERLKTRIEEERAKSAREQKELQEKRDKDVTDLNAKLKESEERFQGRIDKAVEREQAAKQGRDEALQEVGELHEEVGGLRGRLGAIKSTATEQEDSEREDKNSQYLEEQIADLQEKVRWLERENKRLKQSETPSPSREPALEPGSMPDGSVSFSFPHKVKGFRFEDCNPEERLALLNALAQRSNMTWHEVITAPREGLGTEKLDRGQISAIPEDVPEDRPLLVMRTSKRGRIVGYRADDVFVVVWVDPGHKLYDG